MDSVLQFLDLIILAIIAGLIGLRLRNVLGRRTGYERRPPSFFAGKTTADGESEDHSDNVVSLPGRAPARDEAQAANARGPGAGDDAASLQETLAAIRSADRRFEAGAFLSGARAAYEMITNAFTRGDLGPVEGFIDDDVLANFESAIEARKKGGRDVKYRLLRILSADIVGAILRGRIAEISVKFASELASVRRDEKGALVDEEPGHVTEVQEIWSFSRDIRSGDPNWLLVGTRSVH